MKLNKIALLIFAGLILLLTTALSSGQEILIESLESKTTLGHPVFNKITWFQFPDKDVWMMNQSHHQLATEEKDWDRLAIVVDKTKSPKVAYFYQLESGSLNWSEKLPQKSFRASCFTCHNNGPRAIRPNFDSSLASISWKDQLRILAWNLRVKFYGRILADSGLDEADKGLKIPFRHRGNYENEDLKVATCVKCHQESGWIARGTLKRQQLQTIKFMVDSGQMPPPGFSLSSAEKNELGTFLRGF